MAIRKGMQRFSFLLETCQPGTVPDPHLLAALLDLVITNFELNAKLCGLSFFDSLSASLDPLLIHLFLQLLSFFSKRQLLLEQPYFWNVRTMFIVAIKVIGQIG